MNNGKATHDEYLEYQKRKGFKIETIKITEKWTNIVTTFNVLKGETKVFLKVRCPAGKIILFPGKDQFKNYEDAYSQYVNIFDDEGNNIDFSNVIEINKVRITESHQLIDTVLYNDVSLYTNGLVKKECNKFRFDKGIELSSENLLRFTIINSKNNINKVEFIMKCNMLHKH